MGLSGRSFDRFMQGAGILADEQRRRKAIERQDTLRFEQNAFEQEAATVKAEQTRKSDTLKQQLDLLKLSFEAEGATPETKTESLKRAFDLTTGKDADLSGFEFKSQPAAPKASERLVNPNILSFDKAFGKDTHATFGQVTDFMNAQTSRLKQEQAQSKKEKGSASFTDSSGRKVTGTDADAHVDLIDKAIEHNLKFLQKDRPLQTFEQTGKDQFSATETLGGGNLRELALHQNELFALRNKLQRGGTLTPEDEELFAGGAFIPTSQEGGAANDALRALVLKQLQSAEKLNERIKNR